MGPEFEGFELRIDMTHPAGRQMYDCFAAMTKLANDYAEIMGTKVGVGDILGHALNETYLKHLIDDDGEAENDAEFKA